MSHLEKFLTPPKFLMCDSHAEPNRAFVLHTEFPRFLCEAFVDLDSDMIEDLSKQTQNEFGMPLITKEVLIDGEFEYLAIVAVMETFPPNPTKEYFEDLAMKASEAMELMAIFYENEIASY